MLEFLKKFSKYSDIFLASGIMAILMVLLFPVQTWLLDLLLALSISISIVILMTTLFINTPLDLSVFPTLLLVTTIMRLALNIASVRLILSAGHTGSDAAGYIIEAFGHFVMQGNVVIGLIVFIILTLINFVVITKGSGRIAEVAARFSLDAMPGKQMAIDADLSAGMINEETARSRRRLLEDESAFYGAMDGANKFVRGDAIAGIIITLINLVGGIVIGVLQRGLTFDSAVKTYTILTIGDGLVSQIPALIISLAAGLLVTRSGVTGTTDVALFGQLSRYPNALIVASSVLLLISILPGIPFFPFFILSLLFGVIGYILSISRKDTTTKKPLTTETKSVDAAAAAKSNKENVMGMIHMEHVSIELGYGLLGLVNNTKGIHKLTDQIKSLRKQMIKNLGFVMPSVKIQDNMQLENDTYIIKIKEIESGRGEVFVDKIMVIDPNGGDIKIEGTKTKEPTFGLPAKWINENYKEEALFNNYTVVDPATVITTHLTELIKEHITDLLSYTEVQKLVDELGEEHKKLIKDNIPEVVNISVLQKVLQALLSESISIRDLPLIIEATADAARMSKNIMNVIEYVRSKLSRQICHYYLHGKNTMQVVILSQEWEETFISSIIEDGEIRNLALPPSNLHEFVDKVNEVYNKQAAQGNMPVLLTSAETRPYVRSVIERFRASISVLSQAELYLKLKIKTIDVI